MALEAIAERRQSERFPVTRSVELTTSQNPADYFQGTIVDFSEQGLRIFIGRVIKKGEVVTVHWGAHRLVGKVVHSRQQQHGSVLGVSLSAEAGV